ncbi:MAG: helix-turn-helix domain-containing protein [Elainellaceae cyanobacterium]
MILTFQYRLNPTPEQASTENRGL